MEPIENGGRNSNPTVCSSSDLDLRCPKCHSSRVKQPSLTRATCQDCEHRAHVARFTAKYKCIETNPVFVLFLLGFFVSLASCAMSESDSQRATRQSREREDIRAAGPREAYGQVPYTDGLIWDGYGWQPPDYTGPEYRDGKFVFRGR